MSQPGTPASMTEAVWDAQMDVNLKSVYLCCHHVLPIMEAQGSGSIINIASIAALRYIGKPQVAYSATKAAVIQFTRATALMYAGKGVRLNTVVPGLIHTPLIGSLADKYNDGDVEGLVKKRDAGVPMGKQGDSHDVAYAILFLASQCARHITGQKLVVDGGVTGNAAPG
jgi:NAD(P)-dependent dehydrogenase (short-subunit alcohol dehydrogenase family)